MFTHGFVENFPKNKSFFEKEIIQTLFSVSNIIGKFRYNRLYKNVHYNGSRSLAKKK
ncbi:hypothetical protein BOVMAS27_16590 [Streptococcus uberis]